MTNQEIETLSVKMIEALGKLARESVRDGDVATAMSLNDIMNETDMVTLAKLAQIMKAA